MRRVASRLEVLSRVVAAVIGGYALSAATAICLALLLPMARAEAVLAGTMLSFVIYVSAALWVFAAASATRAWIGLVLSAALLGTSLLVFGHRVP